MREAFMDISKWPSYRSKFQVRAWRIEYEGASSEDTITVDLAGKKVSTHLGDYLVEVDADHRLEHWTKERFEREFELEQAPGRELHLELES
jgi:hypothetical protein